MFICFIAIIVFFVFLNAITDISSPDITLLFLYCCVILFWFILFCLFVLIPFYINPALGLVCGILYIVFAYIWWIK